MDIILGILVLGALATVGLVVGVDQVLVRVRNDQRK